MVYWCFWLVECPVVETVVARVRMLLLACLLAQLFDDVP